MVWACVGSSGVAVEDLWGGMYEIWDVEGSEVRRTQLIGGGRH